MFGKLLLKLIVCIGVGLVIYYVYSAYFYPYEASIRSFLVTTLKVLDVLFKLTMVVWLYGAGRALWQELKYRFPKKYDKWETPELQRHTEVEYHEEEGVYAYRYFRVNNHNQLCSIFTDDVYVNGFLQSGRMPTRRNEAGIYAYKTFDNPEIQNYAVFKNRHTGMIEGVNVLCQVWLHGRIIPTTIGFRGWKCQITYVYSNDQWVAYDEWEKMYVEQHQRH